MDGAYGDRCGVIPCRAITARPACYRVLGPLEVVVDGRSVRLPGPKGRLVLALLVVRAGGVVGTAELRDALWPDGEPSRAANALQRHVSTLRGVLGADRVPAAGDGYRLDVAPDEIDAARFERLAAEGRSALRAGDAAGAARVLAEALALWRGRAFADVAGPVSLELEADRLEELRLDALEDRVAADVASGRHAEVVEELVVLTREHPLRERLWASRMTALHRAGRRAEALRAFQSARRALAEVGLEPGAELRELEQALAAEAPGSEAAPRRSGNVRPALTSFVGRTAELAALERLVRGQRLVTVVGPGGVGKTRLATEVAQLVPPPADGAWLVELAPASGRVGVERALTDALDLGDELDEPLERVLAGRTALLVLDNCEHLRADVAEVVLRVLTGAPGVTVLATSREPLGLPGEHLFPLEPLAPDDAAALFASRAGAVAPPVAVEAGDPVVEEICRRLDGIPLAIELAAARTRALPLQELLERLADRFRLLGAGDPTAPARQRTLRAAIDWSFDLLFADEGTLFLQLAVFAGDASLDAVEFVAEGAGIDPRDTADLVARLVDRSLVTPVATHHGVRYRMLETLRAYGLERLAEAGRLDRARAIHAEWCARFAAGHAPELDDLDDDLRAAMRFDLDRGDPGRALTTATAMGWYCATRGRRHEGSEWLEEALAATADAPPTPARVEAYIWLANCGLHVERLATTLDRHREAIRLAEQLGDPVLLATAQVYGSDSLGHVDVEAAERLRDEAEPVLARAGRHRELGMLHFLRADASLEFGGRGDDAAATRALEEFTAAGDRWGQAKARLVLADAALVRGELDRAYDHYEVALAGSRPSRMTTNVVLGLHGMARIDHAKGEVAVARARWEEARDAAEWMGWDVAVATVDNHLARLAREAGDRDGARTLHEAAVSRARGAHLDATWPVVDGLAGLAWLALDGGDEPGAQALAEAAVEAADRGSDPVARAPALEALAAATRSTDPARSRQLLAEADAARAAMGSVRLPPEDRMVQALR